MNTPTVLPSADTPSRGELEALAERCEAASGPDRELDLAVARLLGRPYGYTDHPPTSTCDGWFPTNITCGRLTASLDAALALVVEKLPGSYGRVQPHFYGEEDAPRVTWLAYVIRPLWPRWNPVDDEAWFDNTGPCEAATPALALMAALLRALARSAAQTGEADRG